MLEDDVVATTKRIMASTFDGHGGSGGKGKGREADRMEIPSENITMESRFILRGTEGRLAQVAALWITRARTTKTSSSGLQSLLHAFF